MRLIVTNVIYNRLSHVKYEIRDLKSSYFQLKNEEYADSIASALESITYLVSTLTNLVSYINLQLIIPKHYLKSLMCHTIVHR